MSFVITWDDRRNDMIVERINLGEKIRPDIENSDLPDKNNYSLKNIAAGAMITFEYILVRKDGICYKVRPFLVYTTL